MVQVYSLVKGRNKNENKNYPSLYDIFELGDRVKRVYKNKNGKSKEYKGIVLAIDNKSIEIYWDSIDGKYRPREMEIAFSNCQIDEIFSGTEKYSSIKKDENYSQYISINISINIQKDILIRREGMKSEQRISTFNIHNASSSYTSFNCVTILLWI